MGLSSILLRLGDAGVFRRSIERRSRERAYRTFWDEVAHSDLRAAEEAVHRPNVLPVSRPIVPDEARADRRAS